MSKKIFLIFPFILLCILLYQTLSADKLKENTVLAIQEISNSIDKYESEFNDLGYEISNLKLDDKEVLSLRDKDTQYIFDIGLSQIFFDIDEYSSVRIEKSYWSKNELIDLNADNYPLEVRLYTPEYQDVKYGYDPFNNYNPDFKNYRIVFDDEQLDDLKINKYISSAKLRSLLLNGLELEKLLVEMHEQNQINGK